jgi:hypothetical protein
VPQTCVKLALNYKKYYIYALKLHGEIEDAGIPGIGYFK